VRYHCPLFAAAGPHEVLSDLGGCAAAQKARKDTMTSVIKVHAQLVRRSGLPGLKHTAFYVLYEADAAAEGLTDEAGRGGSAASSTQKPAGRGRFVAAPAEKSLRQLNTKQSYPSWWRHGSERPCTILLTVPHTLWNSSSTLYDG
jgi:hypothetical protein